MWLITAVDIDGDQPLIDISEKNTNSTDSQLNSYNLISYENNQ